MLSFVVSLFNKNVSYEDIVEETKQPRNTNIIYRDELSNKNVHHKKSSSTTNKHKTKYGDVLKPKNNNNNNKQRRSHGSCGGGVDQDHKGVIMRVKVVMTKQEAARLLSKCKEGGVLGFKDVEKEIVQIPMNRVSVVSPAACNTNNTRGAALEGIPEEF
ncbi:hypothetical protein LWI28_009069 [Acer negundo]|uniref:DUF7890 domain-containing protein n=1 Tax=Acer negundo TaxID=4023 RepID=A0AAD5NPV2_ACENE|nr:hypothetical protein LWI28_009069 [Acer negundo]KAK4845018.1 hypothetical protein QYF36_027335 [Acer negundo]